MALSEKMLPVNIKRLRDKRGLTQEQLAQKAGISHGYLARLEIGMHDPKLETLSKLAKALGVTVNKLIG